jgi:hypothetical protein
VYALAKFAAGSADCSSSEAHIIYSRYRAATATVAVTAGAVKATAALFSYLALLKLQFADVAVNLAGHCNCSCTGRRECGNDS